MIGKIKTSKMLGVRSTILKTIITQELINKVNDFFVKYDIDKNCDDIKGDIIVIPNKRYIFKYRDMNGYSGRYNPINHKIILIDNKITQRLFVHEYMHKKSAKRRFLQKDLLGIDYNKHFTNLNEVITEKITCEILNIPLNDQIYHPYYSMFVAINELDRIVSWNEIIKAYFTNNKKVFEEVLDKDLYIFLSELSNLHIYSPYKDLKNSYLRYAYNVAQTNIKNIIDNHIL